MNDYGDNTQKTDNCWNRIGIRGDRSCEKLKAAVHCRNCAVYSRAALKFFERPLPEDYREEWLDYLARDKEVETPGTVSALIFRIEQEWLALATGLVTEITDLRTAHRIPYRDNEVLKGLVNIHGQIQPCFSLGGLLGVEKDENAETNDPRKVYKRMIVTQWEGSGWVFAVDEVLGTARFQQDQVKNVPETVRKADRTYVKGILDWQSLRVGYLDHELVYNALKRSLG